MNTLEHASVKDFHEGAKDLGVMDRWITSELQKTIAAVDLAMETFRFDLAAKAIYEFIWDELCDWYLELSKPILNSEDTSASQLRATRFTLIDTLEQVLRLAHPYLPFITEEIWQQIPVSIRANADTIMLQPFPVPNDALTDPDAESDVAWIKAIVTATRNIRGEMNISFGKPIPILFHNGSQTDKDRLGTYEGLLKALIKPERMTWLETGDDVPPSATHLVGEMQVLVPLAGLIDKTQEISRLDKEIDRKQKDMARTEGKINNPSFLEKAPAKIVNQEKEKLVDLTSALRQLKEQKARVESL
jgi:valyl-tRNA synthetase